MPGRACLPLPSPLSHRLTFSHRVEGAGVVVVVNAPLVVVVVVKVFFVTDASLSQSLDTTEVLRLAWPSWYALFVQEPVL